MRPCPGRRRKEKQCILDIVVVEWSVQVGGYSILFEMFTQMLKAQFIFQAECSSAFSLEVWGTNEMEIFALLARMSGKTWVPLDNDEARIAGIDEGRTEIERGLVCEQRKFSFQPGNLFSPMYFRFGPPRHNFSHQFFQTESRIFFVSMSPQ